MTIRLLIAGITLVAIAGLVYWQGVDRSATASIDLPNVQAVALYDPACGCCGEHLEYLDETGLEVVRQIVDDTNAVKVEYGIPEGMRSCHTTLIEGYIVEGHMPAEAIAKLLDEQPDIRGIALPGMPAGSPGMGGEKQETWTIYALEHDGSLSVFLEV